MQTRNTNLGKTVSDFSFSNVTFLYKYLFRVKFGLYKMEKKMAEVGGDFILTWFQLLQKTI